jgi:hypothetical protein
MASLGVRVRRSVKRFDSSGRVIRGVGSSSALTMARRKRQVGGKAAARHEGGPPDAPCSVPEKAASVHGLRCGPRSRARPGAQARCAHIARTANRAARQPLHCCASAPVPASATCRCGEAVPRRRTVLGVHRRRPGEDPRRDPTWSKPTSWSRLTATTRLHGARYHPTTSNSASVIRPSEHTCTASISASNTLSSAITVSRSRRSGGGCPGGEALRPRAAARRRRRAGRARRPRPSARP